MLTQNITIPGSDVKASTILPRKGQTDAQYIAEVNATRIIDAPHWPGGPVEDEEDQ